MKVNGFKVGGRTYKPRKREIESMFRFLEKTVRSTKEEVCR